MEPDVLSPVLHCKGRQDLSTAFFHFPFQIGPLKILGVFNFPFMDASCVRGMCNTPVSHKEIIHADLHFSLVFSRMCSPEN